MAKKLEQMAERDEKKGEDAGCLRTLILGHMFLAYNMMAGGRDYEIDKKEEDYI